MKFLFTEMKRHMFPIEAVVTDGRIVSTDFLR